MEKVDDLTQGKIREWQLRRLEIKDRMQSHPEQTLELSKVLDLMDEEHAAILVRSAGSHAPLTDKPDATADRAATAEHSLPPVVGRLELQLHVAASSPGDLRKLLDMAVYELQRQIDAQGDVSVGERSRKAGAMSGSVGDYHFELDANGDLKHG